MIALLLRLVSLLSKLGSLEDDLDDLHFYENQKAIQSLIDADIDLELLGMNLHSLEGYIGLFITLLGGEI